MFKPGLEARQDHPYVAMGMARFPAESDAERTYWFSIRQARYSAEKTGPGDVPVTCGWYIYDSDDGLTWTRRPRMRMSNTLAMDGSIPHGFDEQLNAWIIWFRPRNAVKLRTIGASFARDLERIPFPQSILVPDENDPPQCQFNHLTTVRVPGGLVGLLTDMRPLEGYAMAPQLAFSRDGLTWSRPAGRDHVIPTGPDGAWDDTSVAPGRPVIVGDDVWILYNGRNTGNGEYRLIRRKGKNEIIRIDEGDKLPDGRENVPHIGLARLPRDRWAAVEPVGRTGALQTRRIAWAAPELHVNADARRGSIRAELLDLAGKPIPGFTAKDCDPLTRDSLNHAITWHGQKRLPRSMTGTAHAQGDPGRLMAIRFHLDRARLFAFSC